MPVAAVPAIVAAVGGVASAGSGLMQSISAGKQAKKLQQQIDNYRRQNLTNPYDGVQVSTMGSDLQREGIARSIANLSDQAAAGGGRAIVGLGANAIAQQIGQEQQIAANLDQQVAQIEQMKAAGRGQVQQMTEQRERDDLLGLGQAMATAKQNQANGMNTFAQGLMGMGSAAASGMFGNLGGMFGGAKPMSGALSVQPQGLIAPGAAFNPNSLPLKLS